MRLSEASRLRAIGQIEAGRRFQDVANGFGVHCSTISRLHEKYVATGSVKDLPRPGRPRVTTLRQDRAIRLQHLRRRFQAETETAMGIRGPNRRQIAPNCPTTSQNRWITLPTSLSWLASNRTSSGRTHQMGYFGCTLATETMAERSFHLTNVKLWWIPVTNVNMCIDVVGKDTAMRV